ncbi:hypothetical protein ACIBG0_02945 [Nocardia sp. NPDC050630]|uniref:hypothetical protein n=1 Tax=Nocardia sp. NPDC050630 TaxID=3364321 RepID=UPI0037B0DE0F
MRSPSLDRYRAGTLLICSVEDGDRRRSGTRMAVRKAEPGCVATRADCLALG